MDIVGRCIGRTQLGKKCLFVDIVASPEHMAAATEPLDSSTGTTETNGGGVRVHYVAGHEARAVPMAVATLDPAARCYSVRLCLASNGLPPDVFLRLTTELGCPGSLQRPRIGDVFRMRVTVPTSTKIVNGVTLHRVDAVDAQLLARGEAARPGDYSVKWSVPEAADHRKGPKVGVPRRHGNRFRVFADWCVATLLLLPTAAPGLSHLGVGRPRGSVLDVAGGGGKLSDYLSVVHAVRCTIVDPRPVDPGRGGRKVRRSRGSYLAAASCSSGGAKRQRREAEAADGGEALEDESSGDLGSSCPADHASATLSSDTCHYADDHSDSDSDSAVPSVGTPRLLLPVDPGESVGATPLSRPRDPGEGVSCIQAFFSSANHAEAIDASDAILGLHCDGAVNEIVRAACERRKSSAIVACCVFPKMFPRTLNDGRPVILRGELNDWILEECARRGYQGTLGRGQLPFEGANEVVYGIAGQGVRVPGA